MSIVSNIVSSFRVLHAGRHPAPSDRIAHAPLVAAPVGGGASGQAGSMWSFRFRKNEADLAWVDRLVRKEFVTTDVVVVEGDVVTTVETVETRETTDRVKMVVENARELPYVVAAALLRHLPDTADRINLAAAHNWSEFNLLQILPPPQRVDFLLELFVRRKDLYGRRTDLKDLLELRSKTDTELGDIVKEFTQRAMCSMKDGTDIANKETELAKHLISAGVAHPRMFLIAAARSVIRHLPASDHKVQESKLSLFWAHKYLHAVEILQELVQIMPGLGSATQQSTFFDLIKLNSSRLMTIENNVEDNVAPRRSINIEERKAFVISLIRQLPQLDKEAQRCIFSEIIKDTHNTMSVLRVPEILIAFIQILPQLPSARLQGGKNIQGQAYTVLKHILRQRAFRTLPTLEKLRVIVEMANVHHDLSTHRRPENTLRPYVFPLLNAVVPVPAAAAVLGAIFIPGGAAIAAGVVCGVGVAAVGGKMVRGSRSVQRAVRTQIMKLVQRLGPEIVSNAMGTTDALIALAPALTTLAAEAYPRLSEKRKVKAKETIERMCGSWIDTMSAESDEGRTQDLFVAMAPVWKAVLKNVYPSVSEGLRSRIQTRIVEKYNQLGGESQRVRDAWNAQPSA